MRLIQTLVVALLVCACSSDVSEEDQVRAAIRNMEAAAEEGLRDDFLAIVREDFGGSNGVDKPMLGRLLISSISRYNRIRATLGPIDVQVYPEQQRAQATFDALLLGGANLLPESGETYSFDTVWQKTDGRWLLLQASWTE